MTNQEISFENLSRFGGLLQWLTRQEISQIDAHVDELAEVALGVNRRICAAFGNNFSEVIWQSDVYEFGMGDREHQRGLLEENDRKLYECVTLLEKMIETGEAPLAPAASASPAVAPLRPMMGVNAAVEGQRNVERSSAAVATPRGSKKSAKKKR